MGDISVPLCTSVPFPSFPLPSIPLPSIPLPSIPLPFCLYRPCMVDYIYRCGLSVLSFGKSVQSYEKFLTCANKTQKIAVICVFLIIFIIFMSSFVHYLCPPPSISRAILLPALHPPFRLCPPPSIVRHFLFLHPPCMADRKCRLLYCLFVFSLFKGKGWGRFRPLCRLRAGFFFHYSSICHSFSL